VSSYRPIETTLSSDIRNGRAGRSALVSIGSGAGDRRPGSAHWTRSARALNDPRRIADTVLLVVNRKGRSATHEFQLTPLAENWTP
jgi:hypothetical protein